MSNDINAVCPQDTAMSFIKPVDLRHLNIREAIQAVIDRKVDRIEWSESVNLKLDSDGKQATATVSDGKVEVDIPGAWSPDLIQVTANNDGTGTISLTIKDLDFRWK